MSIRKDLLTIRMFFDIIHVICNLVGIVADVFLVVIGRGQIEYWLLWRKPSPSPPEFSDIFWGLRRQWLAAHACRRCRLGWSVHSPSLSAWHREQRKTKE